MEALVLGWIAGAAICGALGYVVGNAKAAGAAGFWLGFLLGPLGIIVAFAIDQRPKCPKCLGRVEPPAKVCQHCGETLLWVDDKAGSKWIEPWPDADMLKQEAAERRRIAELVEIEAAERAQKERAEAQSAALRKVGAVVVHAPVRAVWSFDRLLAALCGEGNDLLHWFFRFLAILTGLLILSSLLMLLLRR